MEQVPEKNKVSIKAKVQRLGSTLSSMVMPNIGVDCVGRFDSAIYPRWISAK